MLALLLLLVLRLLLLLLLLRNEVWGLTAWMLEGLGLGADKQTPLIPWTRLAHAP